MGPGELWSGMDQRTGKNEAVVLKVRSQGAYFGIARCLHGHRSTTAFSVECFDKNRGKTPVHTWSPFWTPGMYGPRAPPVSKLTSVPAAHPSPCRFAPGASRGKTCLRQKPLSSHDCRITSARHHAPALLSPPPYSSLIHPRHPTFLIPNLSFLALTPPHGTSNDRCHLSTPQA